MSVLGTVMTLSKFIKPGAESHRITSGSLMLCRIRRRETRSVASCAVLLHRRLAGVRQLQHRRVLTLGEISDQNDLSIRELERIVVHRPVMRLTWRKRAAL